MQLAKRDKASIASQDLRLRYGRRIADFIWLPEHEFTRFERTLLRISPRNAAAFDRGMTHAILKAKLFLFIGGSVTILSPDRGHA